MDKLKRIEGQVFTTKDLMAEIGSRDTIARYVEMGHIYSIGRGFYCIGDSAAIGSEPYLVISKYYPEVVISGRTALFHHGMTDDPGDEISVTVPTGSNMGRAHAFLHFSQSKNNYGVESTTIYDMEFRMYSKERCLVEASKLGSEIFNKAILSYIESSLDNAKLQELAVEFPTVFKNRILPAIQAVQESRNIY